MQEAVRLYALYQGTDKEFKFDESNEQSDDAWMFWCILVTVKELK